MSKEQVLPKAFIDNMKKRGDAPFLFYKHQGRWCSVSWNEVDEKVKHISLGLISSLGVEKGDRIAPISNTIPEMAYCCLAIAATGAIFAAIYHTNSPKECAHVINDSGSKIAFAEDQTQLDKLKKAWNDCPNLEKIIVFKMEKPDSDPRVITLEQLIGMGKEELANNGDRAYYERIESVKPEDVSAIIYTSGTTGPPKGVIFSNAGFIKHLTEHVKLLPVSEKSRGISFLPMAHAMELMDGHWRHVLFGFPQVYAQSMLTLYDDIREMHPTFFFQTPRFYEKVYNEIMAEVQAWPGWKKKLIDGCLAIGARYQHVKYNPEKGIGYGFLYVLNALCYLVFFRKVHAAMGGRVEWGGSGAAPISAKVLHFFRDCNFPIFEGYGLTESQGVISQNIPGAVKAGTIGKPMPGLEVKIAPDREILVKGWARCLGYWNNPEATKELFEGGWLHTGDLGVLDDEGFLRIIGRKKEILITASGKNVVPLNIQNLLKTSPYISEAVVFGEGQVYLTALVTLNEENVRQYAMEKNIDSDDLTGHPAIVELVGKEIESRNQELARIEQIRKFTILKDQFRQDRDELTPTMKAKRRVIEERYKDKIEAMYAK